MPFFSVFPYLTIQSLIFWIVKASNAIIASSPTLPDDAPKIPNTNGQITVSSLVSLSKLIAKHINPIPSIVQEWAGLRAYLQGLWQDVAYNGLNGAVAGALSNMAIDMIKCSAAPMFVDFPGHDSYETVMSTITRGDPDKVQVMFHLALHKISPDGASTRKVQEAAVDVKEQFLIYAYRDLIDFVTDFQKTRDGKPTKRMLNQIGNWDPQSRDRG
ncbi:hypothetical protein GGR55DRAFT_681855 [Xylaria sp. FL0064]|nr:hypothetical protein GGR55DRAFT_681855 [Xylaria sp. FL0064]